VWQTALATGTGEILADLFPQEYPYDPIVVTYNDRAPRTFVDQGSAILKAAQEQCRRPGYALVMIHETRRSRIREHDQLAAMVIRELRKLDVYAAVNHSTTPRECYQIVQQGNHPPRYLPRESTKGKLSGYLRNVALNKVLLTSERWPFVLATPLHADITIGIDVKQNTAGFTVVAARGTIIRTHCSESSQRERLLASQVKKNLVDLVMKEQEVLPGRIHHIVLHRDGRVWDSEREGARQALEALLDRGVVEADATMTILEIAKSSLVPVRFFEVTNGDRGRTWIENPQVGTYHILDGRDGYLCATGRAFPRHGTVQPLHVRYIEGGLPFEACLEDLYYLTALAWTRPEDCTRYPITLKLTDRRLGEDATEYDADALEFEESNAALEEEPV
jgi:argonaute-like protein implicated in RNA metabolism and viral defense